MPKEIHGKTYYEVHERLAMFRAEYPTGRIKSKIIKDDGQAIVMKAQVWGHNITEADYFLLGEGHAQEVYGSSQINKTSALENCETSAWGRALKAAGFGGDGPVASAEEVQNAMHQQNTPVDNETPAPCTTSQLGVLMAATTNDQLSESLRDEISHALDHPTVEISDADILREQNKGLKPKDEQRGMTGPYEYNGRLVSKVPEMAVANTLIDKIMKEYKS